jgi:hypothetical protein
MVAALHVLRYLVGTPNRGLTYSSTEKSNFIAYADADWAGEKHTAKSTTGYVCTFARAAISWQSKRQSVVAKSATEAEYIASSMCGSEIIYLRQLFEGMGLPQKDPQRYIKTIKGPSVFKRIQSQAGIQVISMSIFTPLGTILIRWRSRQCTFQLLIY